MPAIYNDDEFDTLEEALKARSDDASKGDITIDGRTPVSDDGSLTIDQSVNIIGADGNSLVGTINVSSSNTSFDKVNFTADAASANLASSELVTVLASNVSITNSSFDGLEGASRAFVISNTGFLFNGNSIKGFINGSYINPSTSGAITNNNISNSGNGFVVESTNFDISNNIFSDIDRSNFSIAATNPSTNLQEYFDSGNKLDGTGTQIAATRFNNATTINGSAERDYLINDDNAVSAFKFNGLGGDDTVFSGLRNDTIDGGSGTADTVIYSGIRSEYTISANSDGSYTITDNVAERNGVDILNRVELAQFEDTGFRLATVDNTPPPQAAAATLRLRSPQRQQPAPTT